MEWVHIFKMYIFVVTATSGPTKAVGRKSFHWSEILPEGGWISNQWVEFQPMVGIQSLRW